MPKIILENGTEVNISQQSYEELARSVKKELPRRWGDLLYKGGYIPTAGSVDFCPNSQSKNTFRHRWQAEASIALAQLSQLMYVYNDGWEPNWEQLSNKFAIYFRSGKIACDTYIESKKFLAFKTEALRDKFLKNFRDLIEKAKPLL